MSKKAKTNIESPVDDSQLDAELQALIGDAAPVITATAEVAEVDLEMLDAEATAAEIKSSAYAEQEAPVAANDDEAPIVATTTAAKSKTTRAPRVSRAAGGKSSAVLASVMPAEALLKAACLVSGDVEDPALVDALKTNVDSLAKKVGDKAVNLLRNASDPRKLQNYTRLGLEFLIENGAASSKTLTDMLQAKGYTIGTARSQANQLMALLPALKVADRSGRNLALNADSTLVTQFTDASLVAAAA